MATIADGLITSIKQGSPQAKPFNASFFSTEKEKITTVTTTVFCLFIYFSESRLSRKTKSGKIPGPSTMIKSMHTFSQYKNFS